VVLEVILRGLRSQNLRERLCTVCTKNNVQKGGLMDKFTEGEIRDLLEHLLALKKFGGKMPKGKLTPLDKRVGRFVNDSKSCKRKAGRSVLDPTWC